MMYPFPTQFPVSGSCFLNHTGKLKKKFYVIFLSPIITGQVDMSATILYLSYL